MALMVPVMMIEMMMMMMMIMIAAMLLTIWNGDSDDERDSSDCYFDFSRVWHDGDDDDDRGNDPQWNHILWDDATGDVGFCFALLFCLSVSFIFSSSVLLFFHY